MTRMSPGRWARLTLLLAAVAVALVVPLLPAAGARDTAPPAYQRQLTAQVQDPAGAPRAGRDPARRQQGSLAAAAGRRQGAGTRVAVPARGVRTGRVVRQAPPARTPGVTSGGCAVGYGRPGDQCLPARAPGDTAVTCAYVRTLFPVGIPVTGADRLRLDTDRDGVACGPRDAGVPPPAGRPPSHSHD